MALTNTYCLKMTPSQFGQSSVVVNCSQYDSLFRVIQFSLYNGNNEFSIPDNCVVTIRGTKKDLTGFEYQCEYEGNVVTFPIQNQVTVLPGKVPAEIRVASGNEIIGSWNFVFLVEESPLDENTVISETDLPLLEAALEAAVQAESFKNLAEQSATDASTSATEASDSATIATTNALKSEGYAVGEQNGVPVGSDSIYYENNAKWYSEHGGGGGDASWGSITGDIDNQTDLIEKFGDYVTEEDFNKVKYVHVEDEDYPVIGFFTATEEGISGLEIHLDDGTIDGKIIFLPDGMGVRTASNIIIAMIPTKVSQLSNDSGFITSVPVTSVNSKTGAVVLNASDVGALSDATVIPTKTSELQNDSGFLTSVPVTSVNNKTGAVNLSASDVGALPSSTVIPTKTSDLTNDSGFITTVPVTSVNGRTGAITGLQETSNLVTSVSSSSTDLQYPSAKCLYDMVGDIETLLASI